MYHAIIFQEDAICHSYDTYDVIIIKIIINITNICLIYLANNDQNSKLTFICINDIIGSDVTYQTNLIKPPS